jgi:hypothetical protein
VSRDNYNSPVLPIILCFVVFIVMIWKILDNDVRLDKIESNCACAQKGVESNE